MRNGPIYLYTYVHGTYVYVQWSHTSIYVCTYMYVQTYVWTPIHHSCAMVPFIYIHMYVKHTYMCNGPIDLCSYLHTCMYRHMCAPLYTTHVQWSHISIYICTWNIRISAMVPYIYIHVYMDKWVQTYNMHVFTDAKRDEYLDTWSQICNIYDCIDVQRHVCWCIYVYKW